MFYKKTLNHRINQLHRRAFRIAFGNYASKYEELLRKNYTVTIY